LDFLKTDITNYAGAPIQINNNLLMIDYIHAIIVSYLTMFVTHNEAVEKLVHHEAQ